MSKPKDSNTMEKNSGSSVGMGGINTGTISSTDNSNTTIINNNTTIEKDAAEKLVESRRVYRSRCKDLYYDGFITDEGLKELEEFRRSLDLDSTIASAIRDEVKALSVKIRTELPLAGKIKLENLQIAISQNNADVISNIVPELEGWMERVKSSELCSMYYQLNSILYPAKYIKTLLCNTAEEYWKTYWSYVAYSLQGLNAKAEASLAELTAWDSFYPQQNQVLLLVVGYLMNNDLMSARLAYSQLSTGISKELTFLKSAVSEILDTDFSKSTSYLSGGTSFYAHHLFPKLMENIKSIVDANKVIEDEKDAEGIRLKEKIKYQKELILQKFIENGIIEQACQDSGVSYHTFNIWLKEDSLFSSSYNDIVNRIEIREREAAEAKRKEQEIKIKTKEYKSKFKALFEQNKCDVLKTCSEVGISSADYHEWCKLDSVFNDDINYIVNKNKKIAHQQNLQKLMQTFKKIRPFVFAAIILGIISFGSYLYLNNKERKSQAEINQLYESKKNEFNDAYELIGNSPGGLESLSNACNIVLEIQCIEDKKHFTGNKESQLFLDKLNKVIKELTIELTKMRDDPPLIEGDTDRQKTGEMRLKKVKELQKSLSL